MQVTVDPLPEGGFVVEVSTSAGDVFARETFDDEATAEAVGSVRRNTIRAIAHDLAVAS